MANMTQWLTDLKRPLNTLRGRSRAGRTRLPPVTDRSDRTARATPACDRTPIERPTAPTQVTAGRNISVGPEIDS